MSESASRFIVFEGLDGSGTSTQARMLREYLVNTGRKAYLTSEPSAGPVGNLIRLVMSHRLNISTNSVIEDHQLAYLFAADRHDHLYNDTDGICALQRTGATVISTRYYLSSFAYHCSSEEDFELVKRLNAGFPIPDLTLFLDCPIDVAIQRIDQRSYRSEKYEYREKLIIVRKNYESALSTYGGTVARLDATIPPRELARQVNRIIEAHLWPKP